LNAQRRVYVRAARRARRYDPTVAAQLIDGPRIIRTRLAVHRERGLIDLVKDAEPLELGNYAFPFFLGGAE
jgi:hypothetical protein